MSAAGGNRRHQDGDPTSVDDFAKTCPVPCLNSHQALYVRDSDDPVGTLCLLCDQAFTRGFWRRELIETHPDHRAA